MVVTRNTLPWALAAPGPHRDHDEHHPEHRDQAGEHGVRLTDLPHLDLHHV
jgi:hypothetical protein